MPGCDEDRVDGIAGGAGEAVALNQTVGFRVADYRLAGILAAKLAAHRRGRDPRLWAI